MANTIEDVVNVLGSLASGFSTLKPKGIGLVVYKPLGDVDSSSHNCVKGAIVFPADVFIDKEVLAEASLLVADALGETKVKFDIDVIDTKTLSDPRFNYINFFLGDGVPRPSISVGKDYRGAAVYSSPGSYSDKYVREALRRIRRDLLLSEHYRRSEQDVQEFTGFRVAVDHAFCLPRFLDHMGHHEYRSFPRGMAGCVDLLVKLEQAGGVYGAYGYRETFLDVWYTAVDASELLVRDYIDNFPITSVLAPAKLDISTSALDVDTLFAEL